MPTRLYLDTNIWLDFYRSAPEPMSVFDELRVNEVPLVTTEQTFREIFRNRAAILTEVIESVRKHAKVHPYTTALIRHMPEFEALEEQRKGLKQRAAELVRRLEEIRAEISRDPVFAHLKGAMVERSHLYLPTTDELVDKARRRKQLGEPPTSPDKWTIGDELIWETLLLGCPDDLIIVSRDHSFVQNEAVLALEFGRKKGRRLVAVAERLTAALSLIGKKSRKIEEQEENVVHRAVAGLDTCRACGGKLEETGYDGSDGDTASWLFCTSCGKEHFPPAVG